MRNHWAQREIENRTGKKPTSRPVNVRLAIFNVVQLLWCPVKSLRRISGVMGKSKNKANPHEQQILRCQVAHLLGKLFMYPTT